MLSTSRIASISNSYSTYYYSCSQILSRTSSVTPLSPRLKVVPSSEPAQLSYNEIQRFPTLYLQVLSALVCESSSSVDCVTKADCTSMMSGTKTKDKQKTNCTNCFRTKYFWSIVVQECFVNKWSSAQTLIKILSFPESRLFGFCQLRPRQRFSEMHQKAKVILFWKIGLVSSCRRCWYRIYWNCKFLLWLIPNWKWYANKFPPSFSSTNHP